MVSRFGTLGSVCALLITLGCGGEPPVAEGREGPASPGGAGGSAAVGSGATGGGAGAVTASGGAGAGATGGGSAGGAAGSPGQEKDAGPDAAPEPEDAGGGAAKPIELTDILHQAQADLPFSQQKGFGGQVLGTYPSAASIPDYPSGIHGSLLPSGETLRMGRVDDPAQAGRKAFLFQLAPSDPSTSGSKRCEFSFTPNVGNEQVYWVALSAYVFDWGTLNTSDRSLFGMQLHSGDNSLGLSPSVSINTRGDDNRQLEIQGRYQTSLGSKPSQSNATTVRSALYDIKFGKWMDFVIRFELDPNGGGTLEAWLDGAEIWSYQGKLGFVTPGFQDYIKFGYYNWSGSNFSSSRKVLLRSPMLVRDPTGSKYEAGDLRAHVQQH